MGLVASTVLYGLPKTNTFEVRQMIRSNSTNAHLQPVLPQQQVLNEVPGDAPGPEW
jgi:hypothetical protein